jgi:tRNA pseudouridine55 synthase
VTVAPPTPEGLLLIDKEAGHTSMDVCAIVRGCLRKGGAPKRIKVGHGGTLDPMATGLLVVMIGKATRLCEVLMAGEKEYEATVDLSQRSTTDDAEGELTAVPVQQPPGEDGVIAAIARLTGTIMQRPPQFSAMSVGGRRAYDLARAGKHVELAARPVVVRDFELRRYAWPLLEVRVVCGKGTYIRSLARDLGGLLGTGGMLTALRRTRVGRFSVDNAVTIGAVPTPLLQAGLIPLEQSSA